MYSGLNFYSLSGNLFPNFYTSASELLPSRGPDKYPITHVATRGDPAGTKIVWLPGMRMIGFEIPREGLEKLAEPPRDGYVLLELPTGTQRIPAHTLNQLIETCRK